MKKKEEKSKLSSLIKLSFTIFILHELYFSKIIFLLVINPPNVITHLITKLDPEAHRNHFTFNTVKPSLFHM